MNTIRYAEIQQRLSSLIAKTRGLLDETGNRNLTDEMNDELNDATERKELRLAFVGQYNAGKSTIISALTGNKDIKIESDVATDVVSEYHWNNILLMDTPGILAGKVARHDEATKEALKKCDLIFYVITSQLFDDLLFSNFVDLAYTQHLADKIFIVVNKMNMEFGEYDVLVNNYLVSLNQMFSERGYDLSDFPISFIDTNDFIGGTEDGDEDFIRFSHFEQFVEKMNSFVSSKGVIKKQFDTPVRVLQSYVKNIEVSAVDEQIAEFYRQFESKLLAAQRETKREVENVLYNFDSTAMNEVIHLSSEIGSSTCSEAEWTLKQNALDQSLSDAISKASADIERTISENYDRLMQQVAEFGQKDAIQMYLNKIDSELMSPNISIEERKNLEKQRNTVKWLKDGANKVKETIEKMAPGVNNIFSGVRGASGSQLHQFVLNVGHFFGKSFKPWQAVRWASNIAKFAKFGIPVVTGGIDIWMQCREAKKEDERISQIKESKNQFITGYQSEVNRIKTMFEEYLWQVLDNYNQKRKEINDSKNEIILITNTNNDLRKRISALESEYVDFIDVVNNE